MLCLLPAIRICTGGIHAGCSWAANRSTRWPDNFGPLIFTIIGFSGDKVLITHSNTLAWKMPWVEEPGRLQSKGL